MAQSLKDIISNVKDVSMSDSALETLLDFERVLDEMDLYAFQNWKLGELIDGPNVGRYRVSCSFMWPLSLMPDPAGAERLLNFNSRVKWSKDWLEYPVKIETPDDYRPGTKKPRLARKPIWIVEITLPKTLIKNVERSSDDVLSSTLDLDDIDAAYERGLERGGVEADQTDDQTEADMANAAGEEQI